MDRFFEKREKIAQRRAEVVAQYPTLWSNMIAEWKQPDPEDRVWLMYSASYLFRTNNIRWAIDPLTLSWRIKSAPKVSMEQDLSRLSFVLLTHDHNDHLDLDLLTSLRHLPITWVVPEFLLSKVTDQTGLSCEKIVVPTPLTPIELEGISILPFNGLHWETNSSDRLKGVPALGYRIECNGKCWLFPGDTRTYNAFQLPALNPVDIIFGHLWLGRGSALMDEQPLLDAFCRFFLDLKPTRVLLTHLTEFGRDADDYWDESHIRRVQSKLQEMSATFPVAHALMGESILL